MSVWKGRYARATRKIWRRDGRTSPCRRLAARRHLRGKACSRPEGGNAPGYPSDEARDVRYPRSKNLEGFAAQLPHLNHNRMVPCCAIGHRSLFVARLDFSCTVSGTRNKRVLSGQQRGPFPGPEYPGVLRESRVKRCLVPGHTIIDTHLYFLNATIPCKGDATDLNRMAKGKVTTWAVDAIHRVERAIVPALVRIEASYKMIGEFDPCQPLGVLFAIPSRDEDAQGKTMPVGKHNPIHLPCQQCINRQHFIQGLADDVTIDAVERHVACVWQCSSMFFQQRAQRHALPDCCTDEASTGTIGNTFECDGSRRRREGFQLLVRICPWIAHQACD